MREGELTGAQLREQAIDWLLRLKDAPDDAQLSAQFDDWLSCLPDGRKK